MEKSKFTLSIKILPNGDTTVKLIDCENKQSEGYTFTLNPYQAPESIFRVLMSDHQADAIEHLKYIIAK